MTTHFELSCHLLAAAPGLAHDAGLSRAAEPTFPVLRLMKYLVFLVSLTLNGLLLYRIRQIQKWRKSR